MMAFGYECKHFDAIMFCLIASVEVPNRFFSRFTDGVNVDSR
jgi:hypothetical protein